MSGRSGSNRELFRYLHMQLRPWRLPVAGGILATLVSVGLEQVQPHLVGVLIDGLRAGWGPDRVLRVLGVMLGAGAIGAVLLWAQRFLVIRASRAMEHDIRQRLFERLQGMPPSFLDRHPTGDLMTLASSDLDRVRDVLGPALLHLFRTGLSIVFSVAYLLWRDWHLAVWAFLPLFLTPVLANRGMMLMHKAYARIQERISAIATFTRDSLAGIQVVKGYGREETFQARLAGYSDDLRGVQSRSAWVTGALWPSVAALGGFGLVVLVWHGTDLVLSGRTSVGTLSTAVMVFFRLQWPLIGLGWVSSMLQRGATSLSRLRKLEDEMSEVERSEREASVESLPPARAVEPPLLEVRNLSYRYAETAPWALREVDLRVEPGEGVGIAGGPGSGKTTLLHLLSGLRRPPPGTVFASGQDLSRVSAAEAASLFALVPQDGFLFSQTIRGNIELGTPDGRVAPDPAPFVAASCFDQDLPQIPGGLDAVLGERGINLSGGQRQRLALARALARNAPVLLLDDTLSAVDAQTETRILERLGAHLAGRSVVLTSHRYSAFRFARRVVVLQAGSIAESGTQDELLALDGYFARAWTLQALQREIEEA
jgi:ATP-binding cassette subfamily B protein